MLAGCSSDDDSQTSLDNGLKVRRLTIAQTDNRVSRATLNEVDNILQPSWTKNDALTYCNLSQIITYYSAHAALPSGNLTAAETAVRSAFTGDVICNVGDKVAVVYPTTTFRRNGESNCQFAITLSGQDGTLETLATTYHYVYGVATVNAVTDATADATMPKMKSLLTACKFSFEDKDSKEAIIVKTLTIGYDDMSYNGKYPQTATVVANTDQDAITVTAASAADTSAPLSITLGSATTNVYVALLPVGTADAKKTFVFHVTDDKGNTYTGKARAELKEGEFVTATEIGLNKTN